MIAARLARLSLAVAGALILSLAAALPAAAQTMAYDLHNVAFSGGGAASGYFYYNSATQQITKFNIAVTSGGGWKAFTFNNAGGTAEIAPSNTEVEFSTGSNKLALRFARPLPSETDSIVAGQVRNNALTSGLSGETSGAGSRAVKSGGYVTDPPVLVPEPSTVAPFAVLSLLLGFALLRARRRHVAKA